MNECAAERCVRLNAVFGAVFGVVFGAVFREN